MRVKKLVVKVPADHLNTLREALDAYEIKWELLHRRQPTLESVALRTSQEIIGLRRAILMAHSDEEQS